ncbi:MAG: nitroreductase family protein [Kiritimatiellia bacterium]
MKFRDLVARSRSYRRFDENRPVPRETLINLVEAARLSPSGGNRQPLKYMAIADTAINNRVFPHLAWAGYIPEWEGPAKGQRPTAYIIILGDKDIAGSFGCDHGIAAQTIALASAENGLGCCILGSIDRKALRRDLAIDKRYEILLVLAFGIPGETVELETVASDGSIRYWRDSAGVHHVPKRPLGEILVQYSPRQPA